MVGVTEALQVQKTETATSFIELVTLHSCKLSEFLGVNADSLKESLAEVAIRFKLDHSYAKIASEYEAELAQESLSKRE